jgi:hypothetical protein
VSRSTHWEEWWEKSRSGMRVENCLVVVGVEATRIRKKKKIYIYIYNNNNEGGGGGRI